MSYPAISLSTATVGRHRCPQKRLQTARQPPVYPNSSPDHRACNSLTPFRCPHAVHSCPSVREIFRDEFSVVANELTYGLEVEEAFPYIRHMTKVQERMLSDAMHRNNPEDFRQLHSRFKLLFRHLEWRWNAKGWPPSPESELPGQLEQEYRIMLMGLAGRAALIYSSAGFNDANAYLDIGREEYTSINKLTGDISQAVTREEGSGWSLWSDWEREKAVPGEAYSVNAEQYPLAFFSIRLMELLSEPSTTLDLHRRATQIRDRFAANSDGLKGFVQTEQGPRLEPGATTEPSPTLETGPTRDERQQFATDCDWLSSNSG